MERKFRGKSKLGFWVFGSYIKYCGEEYIFEYEKATKTKEPLDCFTLIIPETIGQYIGRKDINGKEIYEGDTFQPDYSEGDEHFTVVWDDKTSSFKVHHYGSSEEYNGLYSEVQPFSELLDIDEFFDEAIVGNIHEEGKSQEITKQHEPRQ